jgi:hypothetical protein
MLEIQVTYISGISGGIVVKTLGVALILAAVGSSVVQASILSGETIRVTHERPIGTLLAGPTDVVVGPGVEITGYPGGYNADFDDASIVMTFPGSCCGGFTNGSFNGMHVFDLNGTIPQILSVTINPATVFPGFTVSRISFDANNIFINLAGLNPNPATAVLALDITAAPEPSTWLFMTGLAAFAAMRRAGKRRII